MNIVLHVLLSNAILGAISKSALQSLSIADIFSEIDLSRASALIFIVSPPFAAERQILILDANI